jgi:hypothetical protein
MRLRYITQADFRRSERTNFIDAQRRGELPVNLRAGDVIAFVSHGRDQILFVQMRTEVSVNARTGAPVCVWQSHRLRIEGGRWNPLMLANYASKVGLKLDGLRRFESYYSQLAAGEP